MASRIFYTTHLFLILEWSFGRLLTEDLGKATDVPLAAQERVFTHDGANRDMVSTSMFKVYEKYSKEPQRQSDGNTVRSFKAVPRVLRGKDVFQFNLSTIQDSELILFASFHFLYTRPRHHQRTSRVRRPRHQQPSPPAPRLVFHGALGNVTLAPLKKGSWQTRDITAAAKRAREVKELVFTAEFDLGFRAKQKSDYVQERLSPADLPYILVYADDQAIDEPNSVALSLQRYGTLPVGEDASRSSSASRIRRELHRHQIQSNEIPEVPYNTLKNHELWLNTYFPAKAKAQSNGRRAGQAAPSKPQVLSFDERTMKKARKRQWSEPRACSRRYLRVDFADIGWSEWVLAPKSFDAYYCAGTCGFPIPKLVHPSNHATIQSIVRAVGIVPGIPEPCCVPENMSPLSVLFLDPGKNMVLKVYPGMSVDTCACR